MRSETIADKKILIVDDFGDMRMMLVNIMRMLGADDVDSANDGESAIVAMEQKKYDIILCDYNLGKGKDGQQVLEEARYRELIDISTVYIMVTAESSRTMVMGAIEYEPDSYLSKPFSKDLIKVRIERALAKKQDLNEVYQAVRNRQLEKAIALLDEKLAKKPKNAGELMRVKADLCLKAGNTKCSADVYERVLAMREVPWAKLGIGKVLFLRKRYQEAVEIFRDLSNTNPEMTASLDWLARCYQMMDETDKARETLENALELSPRVIRRQQAFGDISLQTGDYAKAENAFSQAAKLGKNSVHNNPQIYASLARSQIFQEKHDAALQSVGNIKKVFGKEQNAGIFTAAGEAMVYHHKGDQQKSAQALDKASQLYDESLDHSNNDITLELAKVAADLGDSDKAQALLKVAIQNNHEDDEFLHAVTATLREAGLNENPEDYVAELKKEVVEKNNRGVMLMQKGQLAEAVDLFKQAAAQMKGNLIINTNAARAIIMMMEKHGTSEEGLKMVRQYLERLRRMDDADEALKALTARLQKVVSAEVE